jgi:hypothetical protein
MPRMPTQSPRRRRPESPCLETTTTIAKADRPEEAVDPVVGQPDPPPALIDGVGDERPGPGTG